MLKGTSLPAVGLHYYALTLQMETARRAEPNHEVAIKVNKPWNLQSYPLSQYEVMNTYDARR